MVGETDGRHASGARCKRHGAAPLNGNAADDRRLADIAVQEDHAEVAAQRFKLVYNLVYSMAVI